MDWESSKLSLVPITDVAGYFRFHVPASTTGVRLGVVEDDLTWFPWDEFHLTDGYDHLGILELPRLRTIRGTALDINKVPIPDAQIRLAEMHHLYELPPPGFLIHEVDDFVWTLDSRGQETPAAASRVLLTDTDAQGNFEFRGRFSEPVICLAGADGIPHAYRCGSPEEWDQVILQTHATHAESYRFVDESGEPASGGECAVAVATCWPRHELLIPMGGIPQNGQITLATEATEFATVAVRQSEEHPWLVRSSFWGEEDLAPMVLPQPRDLTVHVVDENGDSVSGATVKSHALNAWFYAAGESARQIQELGETEPGYYRADKVPPYEAIFSAQADGFMTHWFGFSPFEFYDFDPNWSQESEVVLHPSASLEVALVRGENADPVRGALIQIGRQTHQSWDAPTCELHDYYSVAAFGFTDVNGVWVSPPLCQKGAWVTAQLGISLHEGLWDGTAPRMTLTADFHFDLTGIVRQRDQPLADALIKVVDENYNDFELRTDRNGRFATTASKPGRFQLSVLPPNAGLHTSPLLTKEIVIEGQGSLHLDLQMSPNKPRSK